MVKVKSKYPHGEKLIRLFSELYFSGQRRSLSELAYKLHCAKPTVTRLIDRIDSDIIKVYEEVENREKYYYIPRPDKIRRPMTMSQSELTMLYMCQAFTRHLLGDELLRESEKAIHKSSTLAAEFSGTDHFAAFLPGTIDYTPRQNDIRQLMKAMDEKKICEVVYRKPLEDSGKTFFIKPYKLFSYNNALYLHAGMARPPDAKIMKYTFDPLLAVHRFEEVTMTDRKFVFPQKYNFEKHFNQEFGIIKDNTFTVKLELEGYAAAYARERRFSPDQRIRKNKNGKYILTFTASSEPEVLAWVLSHGAEVKVLSPDWLLGGVKKIVDSISRLYIKKR